MRQSSALGKKRGIIPSIYIQSWLISEGQDFCVSREGTGSGSYVIPGPEGERRSPDAMFRFRQSTGRELLDSEEKVE